MPELPDVELFKRTLDAAGLGHRIVRVGAPRSRELKSGASTLRRRVGGHELIRSRRHGKLLFAGLDGRAGWLVLHFGMTGFLVRVAPGEGLTRHPRLILELDDRSRLVLDDQRQLGRVALTSDPDAYLATHRVGPDALELSSAAFRERLGGRRGAIKPALMDQHLIAGFGNVYSDELLFQARLHPLTKLSWLDRAALDGLYRQARRVLEGAIAAGAEPRRMPRGWLLPQRHRQGRCPRCGTTIQRLPVGGRTAWLCPRCQPEPKAQSGWTVPLPRS